MAKTVIDWKAPSTKRMREVVLSLDDNMKGKFAKCCYEKVDGKNAVNKAKAKKWLFDNCADLIEWKNAPKNSRPISFADEVASWLDL